MIRRDGNSKVRTYVRYETERKGFWLKTSLSKNLCKRSHDIGALRGGKLSANGCYFLVVEGKGGGGWSLRRRRRAGDDEEEGEARDVSGARGSGGGGEAIESGAEKE